MPTLITDIDAENANSYVTVEEADTYFTTRLHSEDWDELKNNVEADLNTKEAALIQAARRLNNITWAGEKVNHRRYLAFPRVGLVDRDRNYYLPSTEIPQDIKNAQCEIAISFLVSNPFIGGTGIGLEQFKSVRAGPISATLIDRFEQPTGGTLPDQILTDLGYLTRGGLGFVTLRVTKAG